MIQSKPRGGHFVEDGGLDIGMAVVAGFFPAVVIAHEEDDVG